MNKIIIADSSCLIALDNIGQLDILNGIFDEITITTEIANEYGKPIPKWMNIQKPKSTEKVRNLLRILDPGEAEAIVLAIENTNSILIIDEKKGRRVALSFQIKIIGTLRVILLAKKNKIITDIKPIIESLREVGFRISNRLEKEILTISTEEE